MEMLKPVEKVQPGMKIINRTTGDCPQDICDIVSKGEKFLIQIKLKWENQKRHSFEKITTYKLLCNRVDDKEKFIFQKSN